eukprot:GFUD01019136.1.p1 GENE.GFUD01019136.1~~GFUD01019136.1.p1  ORF type:complete len:123 (+),score=9.68 GFUD01019136.1:218-586(+)
MSSRFKQVLPWSLTNYNVTPIYVTLNTIELSLAVIIIDNKIPIVRDKLHIRSPNSFLAARPDIFLLTISFLLLTFFVPANESIRWQPFLFFAKIMKILFSINVGERYFLLILSEGVLIHFPG